MAPTTLSARWYQRAAGRGSYTAHLLQLPGRRALCGAWLDSLIDRVDDDQLARRCRSCQRIGGAA